MEDDNMYNPDYLDDENEIDWNEQIYALEDDEESDDNDAVIEEDDDKDFIVDNSTNYLTPILTESYIKKQLILPEWKRDHIKFRYNNDIVYGHIIMKTPTGKYVFDLVDISTGIHQTKSLNGDYIDSF